MAVTFEGLLGLQVEEELVEVAGLGTVCVRGMTGGQRDEFEVDSQRRKNAKPWPLPVLFRARLLQACCWVDGKPLIPKDKVEAVAGLPAAPLEPLVEAAMRLSGMGPKDEEEAEKN